MDPVPAELLERRVELIGGCTRKEIIEGMNAGAKSYVADLRNMTLNNGSMILQAHKNIERAADNRLAYVGDDGDRVRINPHSTTRLMMVPRPLSVMDPGGRGIAGPLPAAFLAWPYIPSTMRRNCACVKVVSSLLARGERPSGGAALGMTCSPTWKTGLKCPAGPFVPR